MNVSVEALHQAIKAEDLHEVGSLVASGCNIDAQDSSRRTALHLAAWKGNSAIVQLLLRAKANTTIKAMDGFTALHFTTSPAVAKLLCERDKSMIHARINKGNKTALHLAVSKGNFELAKCLLELGADVNAKMSSNIGVVDLAKDEKMKGLLRQYIDKKVSSAPKTTSLYASSSSSESSAVGSLESKEATQTMAGVDDSDVSDSVKASFPTSADATASSSHSEEDITASGKKRQREDGGDDAEINELVLLKK